MEQNNLNSVTLPTLENITMYKSLLLTILLFTTFALNSQVSFKKGSLINKSFPSGADLIKSEDGFFLMELGGKNITQIDLDENMNEISTNKSVFPEGKELITSFVYKHQLYCFLKNSGGKELTYELYNYNPKSKELSAPIVEIETPDFGSSSMFLANMDSDKGITGITVFNSSTNSTEPVAKLYMLSEDLNEVEWEYLVERPETDLEYSKKKPISFVPIILTRNKFRVSYEQEGKKESRIVRHYYEVENGIVKTMSSDIEIEPENEEVKASSFFLNENEEVNIFKSKLDKETGKLSLTLEDHEKEIKELNIESTIPYAESFNKYKAFPSTISSYLFENDGSDCDYKLNLLVHTPLMKPIKTDEFGKALSFNYFIQLKIKENRVIEETMSILGPVNYGISVYEDMAIANKRLDYASNGKYVEINEKEIFDVFITVGPATISGFTYYYNIEGVYYALHTEYAAGNMNAQLVEWDFSGEE